MPRTVPVSPEAQAVLEDVGSQVRALRGDRSLRRLPLGDVSVQYFNDVELADANVTVDKLVRVARGVNAEVKITLIPKGVVDPLAGLRAEDADLHQRLSRLIKLSGRKMITGLLAGFEGTLDEE